MTDPETIDTYQSVAPEYRRRHADRSGIEELLDRFLALLGDATGGEAGRVLDVGCGPGWESAAFGSRGHEAVGIDVTPAFLVAARREAPAAALARMDMRQIGFNAGAFDGLWACASVLHVRRSDAPAVFEEFCRVLRPGGALHVSVKRGEGVERGDAYRGDRRTFTLYRPEELRALATDAGFAVESVRTEDGWVQLFGRARE